MSDEVSDIKVTLARVTTVMENLAKISERHEGYHEDHFIANNKNSKDLARIKGVASVLSFLGLGGIAALLKNGGH